MINRAAVLPSLLSLLVFSATHADAQLRYGDVCQAQANLCSVSMAQIGTRCRCESSPSPGRIVAAPSTWSNMCVVRAGNCTVPSQRVGTPCGCASGPGRIARR